MSPSVEQASFVELDRSGGEVGQPLTCGPGPTEYTESLSANWNPVRSDRSGETPASEFIGIAPRELSMTLVFDERLRYGRGPTPAEAIAQLEKWFAPTGNKGNPPTVRFSWIHVTVNGYLKALSVNREMFGQEGKPVRASVSLTLVEVPNKQPGQNPTSGSLGLYRTTRIGPGESLQSIAYREYGSAELWRGLAADPRNRIDDPVRVRPGTILHIPSREDAEKLS